MVILATLVYLQKDDKTLMIYPADHKHDLYKGKWNGLGGKLNEEETPEEGAIREVKEESGLEVHSLKLKGILTFPKVDRKNDWYIFVYTSNDFSGKIRESSEGKLQWVETSKLLELNLWEGDYIFLPWLFKNKFFSARFVYDEGKLKDHSVTFFTN